jgi:hypothetical protein
MDEKRKLEKLVFAILHYGRWTTLPHHYEKSCILATRALQQKKTKFF